VARKQLDHKPLYSGGVAGRSALHNNIADFSYLIPCAVEDWQATDA
jgi:hypothetical protein